MLRKLKQNIFPHIGRQVHAIVHHRHLFLAFQGQMAGPIVQFQLDIRKVSGSGRTRNPASDCSSPWTSRLSSTSGPRDHIATAARPGSFHRAVSRSSSSTGNSPFNSTLCASRWRRLTSNGIRSPSKPATGAQFVGQRRLHVRRHKRADVAAQPRDFLHDPRTQKRVGVLRHHENRFDPFIQFTIHQAPAEIQIQSRKRPAARAQPPGPCGCST